MSEKHIMDDIRAALDAENLVRMYRNNTGQAYTTRIPYERLRKLVPDIGIIRFGLAIGSADLIGISKDGTGRFISGEIKTPTGRIRPEQEVWRTTVQRYNGVAEIWRSPEEAVECMKRILGK